MASETSTCNGFFTDHGNSTLNNYFQQLSSLSVGSGGSATNGGNSGAGGGGSTAGSTSGSVSSNVSGGDGNNNENSPTNSSGSSTSSVSSTNSRVHSSNSISSGATPSNQWNEIQSNQQQSQQQQQQQQQQHQQQHQQQQLTQHQHQQQHQQQSHSSTPLSATTASHHHPHHPHLSAISHSLTQNLPAASNTHSIFGTGNFHYKTNNSWTIPSLSCYQRIYNETHFQRNFHPTDASCNSHGNTTATAGNENLLTNHQHQQQQSHHHHHQHGSGGGGGGGGGGAGGGGGTGGTGGAANTKRFQPAAPGSGKSGNSKEICGDDKFKEDGDPWNVEAQAAFLGPNLWDKTLPYDADLKYADLDEFLSENNIPDGLPGTHLGHGTGLGHRSDSLGHSAGLSLGLGHITTKRERSPSPSDCISPDTLNPPSPAESTFSFASSGRDFDPRTRAFSDEELKPQPMIKKSRKQFVPDELKDDKYWARRRKNNIAAKRSRDARRQKENQIAMRARYLEKENATLHQEVEQLKQENMDLRARLSKFQDV